MVSAVRSRPNHYETLGLSPSASDEQIRSAFARMMGMFGAHPVGAAASVSAAFEVLRNPDKRRAYDRALGLLPEPSSGHWKVAGVGWSSPGLGAAWAPPGTQEAGEKEVPAPRNSPTGASQAPVREPRLASFISSSLRDLARPVAPEVAGETSDVVPPQMGPQPLHPETASPAIEPAQPATPRAEAEMWLDGEPSPLDLRRPALIALGAIAAAGLVGAIAGASADDRDQQPPPAKRGITVALPAAAAQPQSAVAAPVQAATISDSQIQHAPRPARVQDKRVAREQIVAAAEPIDQSQSADSGLSANPSVIVDVAQSAPVAGAPKAVAASLPLSNRVIARTIARIGYSCGSVVSTTSVEGAGPGVYKVACSSGETYQATPVRGRYRFRRAGQ